MGLLGDEILESEEEQVLPPIKNKVQSTNSKAK